MLFLNFFYALSIFAIGIAGLNTGTPAMESPVGFTGIFFGGSSLFCAFFSLKWHRHGSMGASFLSFIAALTGGSRLFTLVQAKAFHFSDPQVKLLGAFFGISLLYLLATFLHWRQRPFTPEPDSDSAEDGPEPKSPNEPQGHQTRDF